MAAPADLRLFAATSGWEGPFQHEQVVVAARDAQEARRLAEDAFAAVAQPVCRAKMRIADLGPVARRGGRGPAAGGRLAGRGRRARGPALRGGAAPRLNGRVAA